MLAGRSYKTIKVINKKYYFKQKCDQTSNNKAQLLIKCRALLLVFTTEEFLLFENYFFSLIVQ